MADIEVFVNLHPSEPSTSIIVDYIEQLEEWSTWMEKKDY